MAKRIRSELERRVYAGDTVHCNLCGRHWRAWLNGRDYGRCPGCRSASRSRVLWHYLQGEQLDQRDLRILHFAPEASLRPRLQAWGARAYETCDLRGQEVDHRVDIQRMPFDDGSFDLVLCSHVLEHVPDDRAAMRELRRVCSSRGRVLVAVPIDRASPTREDLSESLAPQERRRLFGEVDHLRFYGLDLATLLVEAGFDVRVFEPARDIVITERVAEGFGPDELLFICRPS